MSISLPMELPASPSRTAKAKVRAASVPKTPQPLVSAQTNGEASMPRTHIAERRFASHARIAVNCDPENHLLEILEGTVILVRNLPDGRRQVLEILGPGMLIGIAREEAHTITAETRSPVRVRIHDMRQGPLPAHLRQKFSDQMGERLLTLHDLTLSMGRKTAVERVASFLLRLAGLSPRAAQDMAAAVSKEVRLQLSQTDIADYLGLRSETVCRIFASMKRDNLIAQPGHGRLVLLDMAEIAARAEQPQPRGCRAESLAAILA